MRIVLAVLMACLFAGGVAMAQKVENADDLELPRTDCVTDQYAEFSGPGGGIPDGDPSGVAFGQVPTPPGETIEDVILSVGIEHLDRGPAAVAPLRRRVRRACGLHR